MSEMMHALLERNDVWFEPEDIANLITGFESTLANLGIKDRNDPATTQVAKLIIQFAKDGQRDPAALADRATGIVRGST
jgi:hypothetical protein